MPYEIEFLSPGESNGDAILIRYGSAVDGYTLHLVDGAYTTTGQTIVDHLNEHYGPGAHIDHVVLSHADQDHAAGLRTVLQSVSCGTLWMNRPWLYAEDILHRFHGNYTADGLAKKIRDEYDLLAEIENIANSRGIPIREAFAGHQIGQFTVLAPSRTRYLELIPEFDRTPQPKAETGLTMLGRAARQVLQIAEEAKFWLESWNDEKLSENPPATSASNESSVVQLAVLDNKRVLLTADAGPQALTEAADNADDLGIGGIVNFMQIPHHGSRRNVTPTVLNRWIGTVVPQNTGFHGVACCSVGTDKPEYPRSRVSNAYLRRGYEVYSCRNKWSRLYNGMGDRIGSVPLQSETFSSYYHE